MNNTMDICDKLDKDQLIEIVKNPQYFKDLFTKICDENNGSAPLGWWLRFKEKLGEATKVDAEIMPNFDDDELLLLFNNYYGTLFQSDMFHNDGVLNSAAFVGLQSNVMAAAKCNRPKIFKFILDNIFVTDVDLDGTTLLSALQRNNEYIILLLLKHLEINNKQEIYGLNGSLGGLIHSRIMQDLESSTISQEVKEEIRKLKLVRDY